MQRDVELEMFQQGYGELKARDDGDLHMSQAPEHPLTAIGGEANFSRGALISEASNESSTAPLEMRSASPGGSGRSVHQAEKKSKGIEYIVPRLSGVGADGDSVRLAVKYALHELGEPDEPIMLLDLSRVSQRVADWKRHLPRVVPHYAVKCNPDRRLLRRLREAGCCFDCTTMEEVQRVLSLGPAPKDLYFSHPCKLRSHMRFCRSKNVNLMTFDNEGELQKVAAEFPESQLLLRLFCEESTGQCPMALRFGAKREEWVNLLSVARKLGVCVAGVSLNVGSGFKEATTFEQAMCDASEVFSLAKEQDFDMRVLDIGGGFPGDSSDAGSPFAELASVVNTQLEKHFAQDLFPSLRIIAEPGSFLTCTAASLLTKVFTKAEVPVAPGEDQPSFRYFLNDGLYGSFKCLLFDHAVAPETISTSTTDVPQGPTRRSSLFGPTCNGFDVIMQDYFMPELREGDWLLWRNMGAYTSAARSKPTGFPKPRVWYYDGAGLASDWNIPQESG